MPFPDSPCRYPRTKCATHCPSAAKVENAIAEAEGDLGTETAVEAMRSLLGEWKCTLLGQEYETHPEYE